MRRDTEAIQDLAVIGIPFGKPYRGEAHRIGCDDKRHADGARGKGLLPFRDFFMRAGAGDNTDHEWRIDEPHALRFDLFGIGLWIFGSKNLSDNVAGLFPRFSFKQNEAEPRQLAMIGNRAAMVSSVSISSAVGGGPSSVMGGAERRSSTSQ